MDNYITHRFRSSSLWYKFNILSDIVNETTDGISKQYKPLGIELMAHFINKDLDTYKDISSSVWQDYEHFRNVPDNENAVKLWMKLNWQSKI